MTSSHDLRTKSAIRNENLKPRKTICSGCPHRYEVITKSCHLMDMEMYCLEAPHLCHQERDGLCRGVVEKMIMNDMTWEVGE